MGECNYQQVVICAGVCVCEGILGVGAWMARVLRKGILDMYKK